MHHKNNGMEIAILGIGAVRQRFIELGMEEYSKRLKRYIPVKYEWLKDVKDAGRIPVERQKELEGELILSKIQPSDYVVILDERGKNFTSREFSAWIEKRLGSGRKRMVLIIGGPYGFSQKVYDRKDEMISLSKMTFSHEMVRLFLIEQIYRAMTILNGEPYHHD